MSDEYINSLVNKIKRKQNQYDAINSMISSYAHDVNKILNPLLEKYNTAINDTSKKPNNPEHKYIHLTNDPNDIYKSLHDQLIKICHPDKIHNREIDNCDFIMIRNAYEGKDIIKLLHFAEKYRIKNNYDKAALILILERQLYYLKENINNIKNGIFFKLLVTNDVDNLLKLVTDLIKYNDELKTDINDIKTKINNLSSQIIFHNEEIIKN